MRNKGQVSIFIIVGIVLVLVVSLFLMKINNDKSKDIETGIGDESVFSSNLDRMISFRQSCVEESIKTAITEYGLFQDDSVEQQLKASIEYELTKCLNMNFFSDWGYEVTIFRPFVNVEINDETITVSGSYPIRVSDEDNKEDTNTFSYTFDKSTQKSFKTDKKGKADEDLIISSSDGDMAVVVQKGLGFMDYEGNTLNSLQIKIADKKELPYTLTPENNFIVGEKVYFVTDSVILEGVQISLEYEPGKIPKGFDEDHVSIMQFDEEKGIWIVLPSTVNKQTNVVSAITNHFSAVAATVTELNKESAGCDPLTYSAPIYIEHLHIPCRTIKPEELPESMRGQSPTYTPFESDLRYVGLFNKDVVGNAIAAQHNMPPYADGEDATGWRWKRNNFDEVQLPLKSGDVAPLPPTLVGSVYALPGMFDTIVARGGVPNIYTKEHSDLADVQSRDQEWEFDKSLIDLNTLDIKDSQGNPVVLDANTIDKIQIRTREEKLLDSETTEGDVRRIITHVNGQKMARMVRTSSDIEIPIGSGESRPNQIPLVLGDTTLDAYITLEGPLADPINWKKVFNPEPNEYAESDGLIKDWDDDDQENLVAEKCTITTPEGETYTNPPCVSCSGYSCKKISETYDNDFVAQCIAKCTERAKRVYEDLYISENFVPWNPSNDGLLDYNWNKEHQLERTLLDCGIIPYVTSGLPPEEASSCEPELSDEEFARYIATPKFYGYGGQTKVAREFPEYRLGPEKGYEGVGNNDAQAVVTMKIAEIPTCPVNELTLFVDCSKDDKCVLGINGGEPYYCTPDIQDANGDCYFSVAAKWSDAPMLSYDGMIHAGENTLVGGVLNTFKSNDVCANMNVELRFGPCACTPPIQPPQTEETTFCGDGEVQQPNQEEPPMNEYCDDGNEIDTDTCRNDCTMCGDGIIQDGEICDNGENNGKPESAENGVYCGLDCKPVNIPPTCPNNQLNPPGETCDSSQMGDTACEECRGDCSCCGDGTPDSGSGETCDDGNNNDADSCRNDCTSCGDGKVNHPTEQCESNSDCVEGGVQGTCNGCKCTYPEPVCGDNIINQPGEYCDGSSTAPGISCNQACRMDGSSICTCCGDGHKNAGEYCDDGNSNNNDACRNDCTGCGDGTIQQGEDCEPPNTQFCDATCKQIEAVCGDGVISPGEECDDGNSNNNDGCSNSCKLPNCGDGIMQPPEQCDDGNTNNNDGCTNACKTPYCGDGIIQPPEQCEGETASCHNCMPVSNPICQTYCQISGPSGTILPGSYSFSGTWGVTAGSGPCYGGGIEITCKQGNRVVYNRNGGNHPNNRNPMALSGSTTTNVDTSVSCQIYYCNDQWSNCRTTQNVCGFSVDVCTPDNSCAANTCIGEKCSNGCGGQVDGTKVCTCTPGQCTYTGTETCGNVQGWNGCASCPVDLGPCECVQGECIPDPGQPACGNVPGTDNCGICTAQQDACPQCGADTPCMNSECPGNECPNDCSCTACEGWIGSCNGVLENGCIKPNANANAKDKCRLAETMCGNPHYDECSS